MNVVYHTKYLDKCYTCCRVVTRYSELKILMVKTYIIHIKSSLTEYIGLDAHSFSA